MLSQVHQKKSYIFYVYLTSTSKSSYHTQYIPLYFITNYNIFFLLLLLLLTKTIHRFSLGGRITEIYLSIFYSAPKLCILVKPILNHFLDNIVQQQTSTKIQWPMYPYPYIHPETSTREFIFKNVCTSVSIKWIKWLKLCVWSVYFCFFFFFGI